jgi:hypothetical protein
MACSGAVSFLSGKVVRIAAPKCDSPYGPQLAPIKRVRKLVDGMDTCNRNVPTLDELVAAVSDCFDRWHEPNSLLRRLCGTT